MTVREFLTAEAAAGRTVEMVVLHPDRGQATIPAYGVLDAKLQAAILWDMGMDEPENVCLFDDIEEETE